MAMIAVAENAGHTLYMDVMGGFSRSLPTPA